MNDDAELLRHYTQDGSEKAFTELVSRHLRLVYFTALRGVGGDRALAEDVAQGVFSLLARKAGSLGQHAALAGWLYTTTRHVTSRTMRRERVRRRREQEGAMHELTAHEPAREWERLTPVIDHALEELTPADREALLVRFFDGRPFADVGAVLGTSPDAARMRVERALEKLRAVLERRGIKSMSTVLALTLATQSSLAVPTGLVAAVSGVALTAGAVSSGAAVLSFMSATKISVGVLSVIAVCATGIALREHNQAHVSESRLNATNQELTLAHARLAAAEQRRTQAENRATESEKDTGTLLAAVAASRHQESNTLRAAPPAAASRKLSDDDPLTHSLHAIFPNGIVAVLGDRTITVDEVRREIAPAVAKLQQAVSDPDELSHRLYKIQNDAITGLVNRILAIKEFGNHKQNEPGRQLPASYIDNALADRMADNFNHDRAKFLEHLASQGLTEAQYRKQVEEDIIYRYMLGQQRRLSGGPKK